MQSINKIVRLFFAGDFCSTPSTTMITVSEELRNLVQSCDVREINFEAPLKPNIELPPKKPRRFFQHDDAPDFLRGMGFNLFSIANNHVLDWGEEGYKKTKKALGEDSFGAGTFEEAYQVKEVEVKGKKIGFLALSYAVYTWPLQDTDERKGLGCAYINDIKVNHVIIEAKKKLDYLFVLPHDGIEYVDAPMPETIARYRDFIDYGADGVFGTHPHCPQGWEVYKGKPVFYSLGNFFFNSKKDTMYRATNRAHWYEGRCVILSIDDDHFSWEVVNTRNVDNVALEIDHGEDSVRHNEYIVNLLADKKTYDDYTLPLLRTLVNEDMKEMELKFQPETIRKAIKVLSRCFLDRVKGRKKRTEENVLLYLFRNDLRRARMLRFLSGKL